MHGDGNALASVLRRAPVMAGALAGFDPGRAPEDPTVLFTEWITEAVAAGVRAPQAMVLATVDGDGRPDARVLLLRDMAAGRWEFASSRLSPKGVQLAAVPHAALTFHWPEVGRQIRLRGAVEVAGRERAAADFRARPPASRAESASPRQSEPMADPADLAAALDAARQRADAEPDWVPEHWTVYGLRADEVEFWQASADRRHVRVRYRSDGNGWRRTLLWP